MVLRSPQLSVAPRGLNVLNLCGHRRNVSFAGSSFFLSRGSFVESTVAAVVTDASGVVVAFHPGVVNVVNLRDIHIVDVPVVKEVIVVPVAAFIAVAKVTEAVVDAAIETNHRTPVAFMKKEAITTPTPVARRP